jgi:hypothetical protein
MNVNNILESLKPAKKKVNFLLEESTISRLKQFVESQPPQINQSMVADIAIKNLLDNIEQDK